MGGAHPDGLAHLVGRLLGRRVAEPVPDLALVGDALGDGGAGAVAVPRLAPVGLVQVGVGIHQAGEQDAAPAVDDARLGRLEGRADAADLAVADQHVLGLALEGADVAQQQGGRHERLLVWSMV